MSLVLWGNLWAATDTRVLSVYYGATIFQGVGIDDSYVTQIILGVVNTVTT